MYEAIQTLAESLNEGRVITFGPLGAAISGCHALALLNEPEGSKEEVAAQLEA